MDFFRQGLEFAESYGLAKHPYTEGLKASSGRALFIQAKCLDLLALQALLDPPIPPEAGPEQRKTYQEQIETVGFQLQDQAVERYRALVEKAVAGKVPTEWAEPAFARLYQIEPDKWSRSGEADTALEIYSSKEWKAVPALVNGAWPDAQNPSWVNVRKGVVKPLEYPAHVKAPFRFLWCGEKGQGPKVDSVAATYAPWKQVFAQTAFQIPPQIQSMHLEVVASQEWAVFLDEDTLLTQRALAGPWHLGVSKEVPAAIAQRPAKGGVRYLRLWAQNQKPTDGFGAWVKLRIKYKLSGNGPVFPWDQSTPSPEQLKKLLEMRLEIPNFSFTVTRAP